MRHCLGQVALSRAAGADYLHRGFLLYETAGAQVLDLGLADVQVEAKVKGFKGLLNIDPGPALTLNELILLPPGYFVLNEQSQKIRIRKFFLHSLLIAHFQGIENAGQPQLLEQRQELGHGMHGCLLLLQLDCLANVLALSAIHLIQGHENNWFLIQAFG
jgi:hypothetical protein